MGGGAGLQTQRKAPQAWQPTSVGHMWPVGHVFDCVQSFYSLQGLSRSLAGASLVSLLLASTASGHLINVSLLRKPADPATGSGIGLA